LQNLFLLTTLKGAISDIFGDYVISINKSFCKDKFRVSDKYSS